MVVSILSQNGISPKVTGQQECNGITNGISTNGIITNGIGANDRQDNGPEKKELSVVDIGADDVPESEKGKADKDEKSSPRVHGYAKQWKDLTGKEKVTRVASSIVKPLGVFVLLYFFICSLDLLSSSFVLLGGRTAGTLFQSELLKNPICGLMIGVICTALLQSSSTSTSIVITMVAANILEVQVSIPIVMGANIGTSITGIIVAVTQAGDRRHFRKAFSAATVHDMFNWLSVIILLPVEVATGYLYHLTSAIVKSINLTGGGSNPEFLKVITKPFTKLIVQVDKKVLNAIASGDPDADNKPLLKYWCETTTVNVTVLPTSTPAWTGTVEQTATTSVDSVSTTTIGFIEKEVGVTKCRYLFHGTSLSEQAVGGILLVIALVMLVICLILMVKLLKSLLQSQLASVIRKTVNADLPGKCSYFTGYLVMLVGIIVTILVQSSSVVISALTPLVGVGLLSVDRVFPMMLGANIGTTSTALIASFAASSDRIHASLQIALCHLFFNLTGILIWYPLPFMRKVPLKLAKFFGRTTAKYRWFAIVYLVVMFFCLPLTVFALSIPGWYVLAAVGIPIILLGITIGIINVIQKKRPSCLPQKLRTWNFLPLWMRSLEPLDRQVIKLIGVCRCCKCCPDKEAISNINIDVNDNVVDDSEVTDISHLSFESLPSLNTSKCKLSQFTSFQEKT